MTTTPSYSFGSDNCFIIEGYNELPTFASFLPGIAGVNGRPTWVFYVNRGQGVASFGVRNKDGAFLEFFPADKAYQLTALRGFRTFLKLTENGHTTAYEPFQHGAAAGVSQKMFIQPHEFGVEESNPDLGLTIRADLFTLAESPIAGLIRRIEISNTSKQSKRLEIIDGLPQVLCYGLNQWLVKFMSRTSEAFIKLEFVSPHVPYFRLKVWPNDSPQVEPIVAGNFFAGFYQGQNTEVIIDPKLIFGLADNFSHAERFFNTPHLDLNHQIKGNQTPSAFQHLNLEFEPGESRVFYGIYGQSPTPEMLQQFLSGAQARDFFEVQRAVNRQLIDGISQKALCKTALPRFDAHVRQCYLDNGLRGGFPHKAPGGALLYLFGRKHGDLERDYNDFLLADTPYSEGNGDFRDVLQNRRLDVFFTPEVAIKNIQYFFSLIQADGYNPCSLRNVHFRVAKTENLAHLIQEFPGLEKILASEFKYWELWQSVAPLSATPENILSKILEHAEEVADAEFDRGYWSDHWSYLVDLLVSYAAIFPDRLVQLFSDPEYTYFDPTHFVRPRSEKYRMTEHGLRQFGALEERTDKKALIAARAQKRYQARDLHGQGNIVQTTLLGKILTLLANKLATLDPYGIGIEMEADRPGWCDALNALPGILGSAVNETIELKRLCGFTINALKNAQGFCPVPIELANFLKQLEILLDYPDLDCEHFWRESQNLKEHYREQVFMGFEGPMKELVYEAIINFLAKVSKHLDTAIDRARRPHGIITYFAYAAEQYRELEGGLVEVSHFTQKELPLFLEGFVHAMRIADPLEAKSLYSALQKSSLYDTKLGMFRLNETLGKHALDYGRIGVFNYGWLENGSIFLHMHYKWVLEMLRTGLVEEFYANMQQLLVAFRNPHEYGRNPAESSSFIVSSGFEIDSSQHGRGCIARLSGSTVELLHCWTLIFLGANPFSYPDGNLQFKPRPLLSKNLFVQTEHSVNLGGRTENLAAHSVACCFLGNTLLVYLNPDKRDSYGQHAVKPVKFILFDHHDGFQTINADHVEGYTAELLRQGGFRRIDILLR